MSEGLRRRIRMDRIVHKLLNDLILDREKINGMIEGIKLLYAEVRKAAQDSESGGDAPESSEPEKEELPHE